MITEVKSDEIAATVGGSAAVEVDLGLAIGEAAKIAGISLAVYGATIPSAPLFALIEGAYSFDPEDAAVVKTDDEQFAQVSVSLGLPAGATGTTDHKANVYFDFSGLSLVTTRNLALICTANGLNGL